MVNQLIAWAASLLLTVGVVWKFVERFSPRVRWSLKLLNETHDAIEAMLEAVKDKKITRQEVERVMNEIEDIQDVLAGK